jgi:hypothetical protein
MAGTDDVGEQLFCDSIQLLIDKQEMLIPSLVHM